MSTTKIQTPEKLLASLNKELLNLRKHTATYDTKKINGKDIGIIGSAINKILKKTKMAQLLSEKYTIAISGLQGVGKSTLMKKFYDLPDNILPENLGRGEKLPIYICENNQEIITTTVTSILNNESDEFEFEQNALSTDKFNSRASNPNIEDVLLTITVPYKHFHTNDFGFLLLPGIENDNNNYWQEFIEHSLKCSSTSIFVFNESSFNREKNNEIHNLILNKFSSIKPLYVLSGCDKVGDQNLSLKETVKTKYKISKFEEDRILISGTPKKYCEIWIPKLKEIIVKYSENKGDFRHEQLQNLKTLIQFELNDIFEVIDENTTNIKIEEFKNNEIYEECISIIKDQSDKIKGEFLKQFNKKLHHHTKKTNDRISDYIITNSSRGIFENLKRIIFDPSLKDIKKINNDILNLYLKDNENHSIEYLAHTTLTQVSKKYLYLSSVGKIDATKNENILEKQTTEFNDSTIINLNSTQKILIALKTKEDIPSKELHQALELVPVLSMELSRFLSSAIIKSDNSISVDNSNENLNKNIELLKNDLEFFTKESKIAVAGIASILGVDLAVDGAINTIPALLGALGISSTTAIFGGAMGIGLIGCFAYIKSINRMQFNDYTTAQSITNEIEENIRISYKEKLDEYFNFIIEYYQVIFKERYEINSDFSRREKLIFTKSKVKELRSDLIEIIDGNIK